MTIVIPMEFSCACGATITVPDLLAGHRGRCPSCEVLLCAPPLSAPRSPDPQVAEDDPAFRLVRVDCTCGREVPAPLRHVRLGKARCPTCDRLLQREST